MRFAEATPQPTEPGLVLEYKPNAAGKRRFAPQLLIEPAHRGEQTAPWDRPTSTELVSRRQRASNLCRRQITRDRLDLARTGEQQKELLQADAHRRPSRDKQLWVGNDQRDDACSISVANFDA
jgi:hypothetical protein